MAKQLNIFEVEPNIMEFDVTKAKVKRRTGNITYTDVCVVVPRNARSTDELPKTTKADDRYEVFEEHAVAIWRFNREKDNAFSWEAAEELCKAARDHKEAIPARIYLGSGFCPNNVVEYLK
ncbi:cell division protein SepF [Bacillus multifaciens]|uniref:cell division protein SepF n=1 Tax=Bacillus multifaciens TaxID=3068506 RepID=UPI00274045C4|nr:cell division protein SepF [Bacillus sp. WLY-B-L8]MDP7979113.1 cell division protein SepF [Bacillus sp. WLY-B-L8]